MRLNNRSFDRGQSCMRADMSLLVCEDHYTWRRSRVRDQPSRQQQRGAVLRQTHRARMEDDDCDDPDLLSRETRLRRGTLRRLPRVYQLRRHTPGTLPVRSGKAHVRKLPGPLLSTPTSRLRESSHALRRAEDALAPSHSQPVPLAGRLSQSACDRLIQSVRYFRTCISFLKTI
jgi:hypothetical protein